MVGPSINSCKLTLKSTPTTIKFLCSYGGKIFPRYPDGKLRYHGGETRVLAVDRSISFAELLVKLGEMCGTSVSLRCKLPTEDLDALVSITSDEDLASLIEEYDRAGAASPTSALKIRAFLSLPKSTKKVSPTSSIASPTSNDTKSTKKVSPTSSIASRTTSPKSLYSAAASLSSRLPTPPTTARCIHLMSRPPVIYPHPLCYGKAAGKLPQYAYYSPAGNTSHIYLIHNGNHWQ